MEQKTKTTEIGAIIHPLMRAKKLMLAGLMLALGLAGYSAKAANWYVQPNGTGNGTSWSSAWKPSTVSWSSVQPGDTIWLAGGSYSGGFTPGKSGTAGNLIYIKRATSGDSAATSAAGWSSSYDSQAIISASTCFSFGTANMGSYLYVDGRSTNGIKLSFSANSWSSGSVYFTAGGMHDITFTNIDMAGPGGTTPYNYQGDCSVIGLRPSIGGGGNVYNVTVADCNLHGGPNLVYNLGGNYNFTFLRSKFYDNGSANSAIHANMIYTSGGNRDWTFAFCDFSNWQVEGINLYQQTSHPHYFYGNTFHDPMGSNARCFWLANESGSPTGPIYLYNNVFVGVNITIAESRASPAQSSSIARNNIYWNSTFWSGSAIANSDYNFSNGTIPGANSISGGSNPFVNEGANDFRIVSTVGAKYPKDKGTAITVPYNLNPDGGAWDMGFTGVSTQPPPTGPQPPTVSAISHNALDVNPLVAGLQILEGTVVQYSGSASDPNGDVLTWSWIYTINGGAEVVHQTGTGTIPAVSFAYAAGSATRTYVWKLRVRDASATVESQTTVAVEALPVIPAGLIFQATSGVLTGPFTAASGYISQASETTLANGGRAVYGFTITNAGRYVIQASVNAPDAGANSFFVNIDSEPQDPASIWQIPMTSGFENRVVSWQGAGTFDNPEFVPKVFNLTAGNHQLIVRGREANTQLGQLSIVKLLEPPTNLRVAP